jgi:enolase
MDGRGSAMKTRIVSVRGRRIWDSRGRPTVEAEVTLEGGAQGRGMAPAGASRGRNEAVDLRDGGQAFGGYGVTRAVENVNRVIPAVVVGLDATDQPAVDAALRSLDGTPTKATLGGNATIAVSLAVLHAAAAAHGQPLWRYLAAGRAVRLPLPEIQIFGGGAHAGRRIDIQDLMVMPIGAQSFDEALVMAAEVYRSAGELMARRGRHHGVADEGGWWPDFASNEEALSTLVQSIERAGFSEEQVAISLDVAASEFGADGHYRLALDNRSLDTGEWLDMLTGWVKRYPILSVEDPFAEDDSDGMCAFTREMGDRVQVIGDDFLVTNAARVDAAAAVTACNAVLLKPNQAGTITETRHAMDAARKHHFGTIVSARSGETEDVTIVHLAAGWDCGQLKVGSLTRSERTAKWNEGLRIEAALGGQAQFAGRAALPQFNRKSRA